MRTKVLNDVKKNNGGKTVEKQVENIMNKMEVVRGCIEHPFDIKLADELVSTATMNNNIITFEEVDSIIPNAKNEPEAVDALHEYLESKGIDIVSSDIYIGDTEEYISEAEMLNLCDADNLVDEVSAEDEVNYQTELLSFGEEDQLDDEEHFDIETLSEDELSC